MSWGYDGFKATELIEPGTIFSVDGHWYVVDADGDASEYTPEPAPVTRHFYCQACRTSLLTKLDTPLDHIDFCAFCPIRDSKALRDWIEGTTPLPITDEEIQARVWEEAAKVLEEFPDAGPNPPKWFRQKAKDLRK